MLQRNVRETEYHGVGGWQPGKTLDSKVLVQRLTHTRRQKTDDCVDLLGDRATKKGLLSGRSACPRILVLGLTTALDTADPCSERAPNLYPPSGSPENEPQREPNRQQVWTNNHLVFRTVPSWLPFFTSLTTR